MCVRWGRMTQVVVGQGRSRVTRYEAAAMIQVGGGGGSHQGTAVGWVKGVGFCFEKRVKDVLRGWMRIRERET